MEKAPPIRHETQSTGDLCLKYALNNICQRKAFTKRQLDAIARSLSPTRFGVWNPHCGFLFSGDYDANVMMAALASIEKDVSWHDARDAAFAKLDPAACWALILNTAAGGAWAALSSSFRSGRHYSGLRRLHGAWWHMDSLQPFPEQVTFASDPQLEAEELRTFLRGERARDPSMHLFKVTELPPNGKH